MVPPLMMDSLLVPTQNGHYSDILCLRLIDAVSDNVWIAISAGKKQAHLQICELLKKDCHNQLHAYLAVF